MKTMTIPVNTPEKTMVIKGIELKRFFVHRSVNRGSKYPWTITHIASGRLMPHSFRTRSIALAIARRLDDLRGFDDLPINESISVAQVPGLVAEVRAIYAEFEDK